MAIYALYRAPGDWQDKLIRAFTGSPYSHVELLHTRPSGGEAWCISASKRDGSRVRHKMIQFKEGHWDFVTVPDLDPDVAWERAAVHLGSPYDTIGAILTVTPWARPRDGQWFCSELMGLSAGLSNPHTLTPGRLAISLLRMGGNRKQFGVTSWQ